MVHLFQVQRPPPLFQPPRPLPQCIVTDQLYNEPIAGSAMLTDNELLHLVIAHHTISYSTRTLSVQSSQGLVQNIRRRL